MICVNEIFIFECNYRVVAVKVSFSKFRNFSFLGVKDGRKKG